MANISFPSDGHRLYSQIEERSFWYNHRNDILLNALRNFPPPGDLLDVGGGTGFVALALTKAGFAATVVEPDPEGAEISRVRGLEVIEEPFQSESIEPGSVSAIGAFDVIEHIENDAQILNDFAVALAPKGRLYLTVPAFAWLWNQEDVYAGHFRRYSASDLQHRVEAAGLEVAYTTYLFAWMVVPLFLWRAVPSALGLRRRAGQSKQVGAEHVLPENALGAIISRALAWERRQVATKRRIGMGTSILAIAEKTGHRTG